MPIQNEIITELKRKGADFVHFANISQLSKKQNKGLPNAILFGIILSRKYIEKVSSTPDYVEKMVRSKDMDNDEFHVTEQKTDKLADFIADYISQKGYKAYSQSEDNIYTTGYYDEGNKCTPLPHKTIALLAGLGWIGKHNLLVTPAYGSAVSMCTVLTDAPLQTILHETQTSRCGECIICKNVCPVKAIKGTQWKMGILRNEIVDVGICTTCLLCLALCPWTQKYMKKNN